VHYISYKTFTLLAALSLSLSEHGPAVLIHVFRMETQWFGCTAVWSNERGGGQWWAGLDLHRVSPSI